MDRIKKDSPGRISEVFKSIQGEGMYAGMITQIFVRFSGCNLKCKFCDTQHTFKNYKEYKVESILKRILYLSNSNNIHSVSITGGEPLLQIDFLENLCYLLEKNRFKIYLETNGVIYNNLKYIIKLIDYISMDFKLPSSTKLYPFWNEHFEFLKIACKKNVFVKAVVSSSTDLKDIIKATNLIASINKNIPFIIQPVTSNEIVPIFSTGKIVLPPSHLQILKFFKISNKYLTDVRIIPQLHKLLGIK